jgi:hypothetical protein
MLIHHFCSVSARNCKLLWTTMVTWSTRKARAAWNRSNIGTVVMTFIRSVECVCICCVFVLSCVCRVLEIDYCSVQGVLPNV